MSPAPRASRARLEVGLALFAVYVIWGSTYFAIRVALEGIPPFLMAGVRFVVAGGVLYAMLRAGGAPAPTREEWRSASWTGALLLIGGNGLVCLAEQSVSSSLAAIVVATMPLWAVLFGSFAWGGQVAGERPSRLELAGVVVGFVGVAILNAGGGLEAHGVRAVLLLLAPVCWSLGSLASRRVRLPAGPMASAAQMLAGGIGMLVIGAVRGERLAALPGARPLLALLYLIVFGSLVAFRAYGFLLRTTRPATATSYAYVNPVVAVLLGVAFAGEEIHPAALVGAVIILGSLALLSVGKKRKTVAVAAPIEAAAESG